MAFFYCIIHNRKIILRNLEKEQAMQIARDYNKKFRAKAPYDYVVALERG